MAFDTKDARIAAIQIGAPYGMMQPWADGVLNNDDAAIAVRAGAILSSVATNISLLLMSTRLE